MTTNKMADQKGIRKAAETALKGFPKAKIKKAFDQMASNKETGDAATEQRQLAANEVCAQAVAFRAANAAVKDLTTITKGWRENLSLLVMQLAVAGNKFAELTPAKDDKPAIAKLTGYGNNVASIAKGCIEFEIQPEESFRDTRKAVEAARAEARRADDPQQAELDDAKSIADEAWKELRELVHSFKSVDVLSQLTETLTGITSDIKSQQETPEKTDVDAEIKAEIEEQAQAA